jgi:hypothetical protein
MPYFIKEDKETLDERYRRIRELPDFCNDDCEDENEDWEDEVYND